MRTYFSADFFRNNRQKLRTLYLEDTPMLFTASNLLQRNGDTTYPFRQDSSFWYLTGIDEPDILLFLDGKSEYLIVPARDKSRINFDGDYDTKSLKSISGIDQILDEKAGWKLIKDLAKKKKTIATLGPISTDAYYARYGAFANPARAFLLERLIKECGRGKVNTSDLSAQLITMRSFKQPPELKAIQSAIDLTEKAILSVFEECQNFGYEYEVEAALTAYFRRADAGHAYSPIVAGGKNACTLHYIANNSALSKKQLLLIDAGAEVNNYAADITRTFALGKATSRQKQVLDAVLEVQKFAASIIKPGVLLKDYEQKVETFMGGKLKELGLIKQASKKAVRKYYPHSTSHFLGLDVHDVGGYHQPLDAGMVLTIEPGIYIPEENIGVRIEDDVLITEKGVTVLSKKLPSLLLNS